MENLCDNKSVGVVVSNPVGEILLLDRAKFPFGLASPAGHIDDHGSPEQAAVVEVFEEVGLNIPLSGLVKAIDGRRIDNKCRRQNGDHHIWTVFLAEGIEGEIIASPDETKGAAWYSSDKLNILAERTLKSQNRTTAIGAQVLEPVWLDFLNELGKLDPMNFNH